jgi:hypothetical protein
MMSVLGVICYDGDNSKARYRTSFICRDYMSVFGTFAIKIGSSNIRKYYFTDLFVDTISYAPGMKCLIHSLEPYETS